MRVPSATSSDLETSPFHYKDDMEDTRALFFVFVFYIILLTRSQSHCLEEATTDSIQTKGLGGERISSSSETECSSLNMWFVRGRDECRCGLDYGGIVDCDSNNTRLLSVLDCNCLTWHVTPEGRVVSVVGSCIFNCLNTTTMSTDDMYHRAPSDCSQLNRKGTLCGECKTGYTMPAYSYTMKCIECNTELRNWGLYVARALGPLTLFIGIILTLRIKVLSPKVQVFVLGVQILTSPVAAWIIQSSNSMQHQTLKEKVIVIILANIYGIWNLDFLRFGVMEELCINASPLQLLTLDYVIAVYPMFLMAFAYIVVQLHYCGFKPILYAWKPFHPFFARFRQQWGIKTSVVDAFATFFFLSTNKLFSVSFTLIVGTRLHTPDGETFWSLFYVPSTTFLGEEHLPYFVLAVGVLCVFVTLPTSLLLFFQCPGFQKLLKMLHLQGSILDEFVCTFHHYYSDGRDGGRDTRWFAGFFVILQLGAYITYASSLGEIALVLQSMLFIILAMMVLLVQPYREEYEIFNTVYTLFLLWLALTFAVNARESMASFIDHKLRDYYVSSYVVYFIPLVYITGVIVHHFYNKCSCLGKTFRVHRAAGTPELPHRLLHSSMYLEPSFT